MLYCSSDDSKSQHEDENSDSVRRYGLLLVVHSGRGDLLTVYGA